ncbi:N-acetylmuramoyl-L-alanine amidase [Aquibacillus halophilus]|nr:N-acetylmuramoyl-L-alanine amidase [Aquibacillus halophilus]
MLTSKKYVLTLITSILIILSISSIVYASEALINVNNLNVRNGPGTDFDTIMQVHEEETYEIIREQNGWIEIQLEQGTGWITKEFISIQGTETVEQGEDKNIISNQSVTIIHDKTTLREGPSTDYEIIGNVNQGTTLEVFDHVGGWYEVQWNEERAYIPDWSVGTDGSLTNGAPSVKDKTIVIDAGHGGRDVGAIGASGNFEKEYTIITAQKLKYYLEILGANVILTRSHDNYLSLSGRASLANAMNADVFLSIHYNSTPQFPSAKGASTYYYSERDSILATTIQEELLKATTMDDRGIHQESFQVTRESHRPSVLLELGFISNISEEQNIQSSVFQEKISKGIINGLNEFFSY